MRAIVFVATASTAFLTGFAHAQGPHVCAARARQAAVAHIEQGPAIGQVSSPGSAFALDSHRLRFEVDVFGPQSYVYRVDVTLDGACNVLAFDTQLLNNPWGGWR